MTPLLDTRRTTRHSALWGTGSRGGDRRRRAAGLLALAVALMAPAAATAGGGGDALVPEQLASAAAANPDRVFHVIVQAARGVPTSALRDDVGAGVHRDFTSLAAVAADLTGKDMLKLARHPHVLAITPDAPTSAQDYQDSEMWRRSADIAPLWTGPGNSHGPPAPAIAVVDSGIDASRPD